MKKKDLSKKKEKKQDKKWRKRIFQRKEKIKNEEKG